MPLIWVVPEHAPPPAVGWLSLLMLAMLCWVEYTHSWVVTVLAECKS